jgi:hypothetical protein
MKRIGFVLPGLGHYGGINVVLNWAAILARSGYDVDIILPPSAGRPSIPFLSEEDGCRLHLVAEPEARRRRYHAAIATWWGSIPVVADLNADHHAWFMQAYEGQFFALNSPAQADFDELVASQMNVITIAHWLEDHILRHYGFEPKQTFCVPIGLDATLWKPVLREPLRRGGRGLCFLVEGPVNDPRKHLAPTIRMLEGLGLPYRWVGARVDRGLVGPHCRGVEEQVPYGRMPEVYRSADVLVKASSSEGMFAPPLEMFATGGTAVLWDVQGAEEYVTDRHNAYLVPMNSWSRLAEAVLELADDPERVRTLQENARATAAAWPTWEDQADQIRATIESLVPFGRCSLVRHVAKNQFRTILHSEPVVVEATRTRAEAARADYELARADAEAARALPAEGRLTELHHVKEGLRARLEAALQSAAEARQAEAARAAQVHTLAVEMHRLKASRTWRLAHLLQRARKRLAPDGSRRLAYLVWTGRGVWRAGRRLKPARRAA